jgi:hypothetical protein
MSALPLLLSLSGCSINHGVRPLGKGKAAVTGSLGGPIVEVFDAPIPLPMTRIGARYGVSDRSDVHLGLHPSMYGFFRLVGVDAGASYLLAPQLGARPAVNLDGTLLFVGGDTAEGDPRGGSRLFADASALASWSWGERGNLAYTGAEFFAQPRPWGLYAAPVVGNRFQLGEHLGLSLEAKWWNPWVDAEDLTLHYIAPGQQGAISLQAGLTVTFGGEEGP